MKNDLYPQPHQPSNGSFDDYDSVIGNEFSVNSSSTKNKADGGGDSHYSDDMSSLGHSHMGPPSAANSPARMTTATAAAASANPQPWRQQRTPMTPMSSGSSDDGLHVGDVSLILGGGTGRTPGPGGGDIESVGGDSLFMMSPPVVQSANLERDAAEWNPKPTHRYDAGVSKYLQLGPLGDELSFGGNNAPNNSHPNFANVNTGADSDDDEDDDRTVRFLPQGRLGNCVLIGSTILIVGALIIAVVAILNLNASVNNQNDSKFNIDAAGSTNDVIPATLAPTVPPSTLAPTVPPSTLAPTVPPSTISPTPEPTVVTDSPTPEPTVVTDSPTAMPIVSVIETDSPVSSNISAAPSKEPTTESPTNVPTVATPAPTTSAPSKEPTTDAPTNVPTVATPKPTTSAPIEAITTDKPTPAPSKAPTTSQPTTGRTEGGSLSTASPSKAPSTDSPTNVPTTETPTISHQPTLSPTKQTLLTVGTAAFNETQDIRFYLVSDDLYVRQYWKNNFEDLSNSRSRFMIHVGSATPPSEDCPEEAYERTETSLSFSPVRAFSLPGNNDYPVSLTRYA